MKLTLSIVAAFGLAAAADAPKIPPAIEASKLTSSEIFALQTIADKIGATQKDLDAAKQFQQRLFSEACDSRKIPLAVCEIRPDMTIAAKPAPVKPEAEK